MTEMPRHNNNETSNNTSSIMNNTLGGKSTSMIGRGANSATNQHSTSTVVAHHKSINTKMQSLVNATTQRYNSNNNQQ